MRKLILVLVALNIGAGIMYGMLTNDWSDAYTILLMIGGYIAYAYIDTQQRKSSRTCRRKK